MSFLSSSLRGSVLAAFFAALAPLGAQVVVSFESSLAPAASAGDVSRVDASYGSAPTQGGFQALLTTFGAEEGGGLVANAVSGSSLASFAGLPALSSAFEGSALRVSLALTAGQQFLFDYNFLTSEPRANEGGSADFAFFAHSLNAGAATALTLADAGTAPLLFSGTLNFDQETGFRTHVFAASSSGDYTFTIGVADAGGNGSVQSGLLVDNLRVATTAAAVPEPATWGMLAGAFALGLIVLRRRRG